MIKIIKVRKNKRKLLENLLQLYLHDISNCFPMNFNTKKAIYEYDNLDKYFDSSENFAYLFVKNNDVLGFTLIDKDVDNNQMIVQEMFVLNNYKNKGIGREAIKKVFDMYNGKWTIKSLPCSPKAENFWNKIIKEYTEGNYGVEYVGKYNRAVFKFNNVE